MPFDVTILTPPWERPQVIHEKAAPAAALPVRIAPAVKGHSLRRRVRHLATEQRLQVDSIAEPRRGRRGVLGQLESAVPEDVHDLGHVIVAEYAFIGAYYGTRMHFHRSFARIDAMRRAIMRSDTRAVTDEAKRLILNLPPSKAQTKPIEKSKT